MNSSNLISDVTAKMKIIVVDFFYRANNVFTIILISGS